MDRVVLQSKENNSSESQSPFKNNSSSGLIEEEKRDTSKENFNPKSLSEIASDTTAKLPHKAEFTNNSTTAKSPKKVPIKKLDSSDCDLDSTLDIRPEYPRQQLSGTKPEVNLSFLTTGFNNLGINSFGENGAQCTTFSDDEEMFVECRSFSDLSNQSAALEETPVNSTVIIESKTGNDTLTEVANGSINAGEPNLNETEILASDKNATFECNARYSVEPQQGELDSTPTNSTVDKSITAEEVIKSSERPEPSEGIEPVILPTGTVPASETNISSKQEGLKTAVKSEDITEEPTNSEPEIVYRNIDERHSYEKQEFVTSPDAPAPSKVNDSVTLSESSENSIQPLDRLQSSETRKRSDNVFVDKFEGQLDVQFKLPSAPVFKQPLDGYSNEEFSACGSSYSFGESDLDYLQGVGSEKERLSILERDSVLLKFDPLLSKPVQVPSVLPTTQEEDDYVADFELKIPEPPKDSSPNSSAVESTIAPVNEQSSKELPEKNNEMSVSVDIMKDINIENKTSEINEETKLSSHRNEENGNNLKMADDKREADMREESLLKRISEKDKQIAKMNGVVEAYEKAISELIAEKEQIVLTYEKKCQDLKHDSEQNAHHLASLEATFSDLHAKYERTKQVAIELKDREESILQDRKTLTENLKMQEVRYDKMKSHAMAQLEIANNSLADMNRNHHAEVTKLKALLKKEEISRASVNEQLIQKAKENSELVKICDELINGTQSS